MEEQLLTQLHEQGIEARVVPAFHARELAPGLERLLGDGLLADEFYRERLAFFNAGEPDPFPDALSVIVVAVPRPRSQATFTWGGSVTTVFIPPTYAGYEDTRNQLEGLIAGILGAGGYRITRAQMPLKALAGWSGLAEYGRNNIAYVQGMGSYHQLFDLFTDLPGGEHEWGEPRMMAACERCHACQRRCPTGAIPNDRFVLRAELCLTYHNERAASVPFAPWIDPTWHNALVGCFRCQEVCPVNAHVIESVDEVECFSQEETQHILQGVPLGHHSPDTIKKLQRLGLLEYLEVLPRNLGVLLQNAGSASAR